MGKNMSRNYYLFKSGRLSRHQNTLYIETEDTKKPIPIEDIDSLYLFGECDLNTKFVNYMSQNNIPIHFFNYYGYYSGSFYPREEINAGQIIIKQAEHYIKSNKRLEIAKEFEEAQTNNILRNISYYGNRNNNSDEINTAKKKIEELQINIQSATDINQLMGIEGKIREFYYSIWREIIGEEHDFTKRVKRPPDNLVNSLISFGNSMMYATVLSEIYRSQLNPTISYLHEPGYRRYSLALDIAEIFKPIIIDKLIFSLLNTKQIKPDDYKKEDDCVFLNDNIKRLFVTNYEEKLTTTIKHRKLRRNISYRHLIRLECYKLVKHINNIEKYESFRAWW